MGERFLRESVYRDRLPINPPAIARTMGLLLAADVGTVFVSEQDDGTVVGMIGLLVFEHPFTGESTATELFWWVEPEHRGQGVRLLKRGEQWARDAGVQYVHMVAPTPSVATVYERFGYRYLEAVYQKAMG